VTPTVIRRFLSPWFEVSPSYYNNLYAVLSNVLRHAHRTGKIDHNPMRDVDTDEETKRDVYLSDEDYATILEHLPEEWHRRACDLIYLVSHRPDDVLGLLESDIRGNDIHFTADKNDQDMIIRFESGDDLDSVIRWFRRWKREQRITSPHLVCHPLTAQRRLIGQRVSVEFISRRFTDSVRELDVRVWSEVRQEHVKPTLRDLRPKALTDEFEAGGDSDKGGHKTDAMKRHYRRKRLPMRAENRLRTPRSQ
jgi:hypothetical protein